MKIKELLNHYLITDIIGINSRICCALMNPKEQIEVIWGYLFNFQSTLASQG